MAIGGVDSLQSQCYMMKESITTGIYTAQCGVLYLPQRKSGIGLATPIHGSAPLIVLAPVVVALDPSPKYVSVLGHVTERVQHAMDYVRKKPEIWQLT